MPSKCSHLNEKETKGGKTAMKAVVSSSKSKPDMQITCGLTKY